MGKRQRILYILTAFILALNTFVCAAKDSERARNKEAENTDTIIVTDDDFVIASVLIVTPGESAISSLGHACLRLQCPKEKLDYTFSVESEPVEDKPFRFISGKLNMATLAKPTNDYLDLYKKEGRGVKEYILNIPIEVKRQLWQQMDENIMEPEAAFDFINKGCAVSVLSWLENAIGRDNIEYNDLDSYWKKTRKQIIGENITGKWNHCLIFNLFDGESRTVDVSFSNKVVIPQDLATVLCNAKALGKPLVTKKPKDIVVQTRQLTEDYISPVLVALAILILAIVNIRLHNGIISGAIIGISMVVGVVITYTVLFSTLPCTQWNWLIVPFNPLPLLLWKWRRTTLIAFAGINIIWCIAMMPYTKEIVDWEFIILALGLAITYLGQTNYSKTIKNQQKLFK